MVLVPPHCVPRVRKKDCTHHLWHWSIQRGVGSVGKADASGKRGLKMVKPLGVAVLWYSPYTTRKLLAPATWKMYQENISLPETEYTQIKGDKSALRPPCSELPLRRASMGLTFPPACTYTAAVFALVQETSTNLRPCPPVITRIS